MPTASPLALWDLSGAVLFDPHPGKQSEILQRLAARVIGAEPCAVNYFLRGNRGSGKSRLVRAFLHGCAAALPGFKYAVVRRNMPDLRLNHTNYLGAEMRRLGGDFHETFGQCRYANGNIGVYRQCEDEADAEQIVGAEVAALFIDEAPQIAWDLLRLLGPSLRIPKNADGRAPFRGIVIYGGNPIGESIDKLDQYFVDKAVEPEEDPEYSPDDFELIEIHRKDNPSIDEAEYRKQFAGLLPQYRKAWLDGVRMEARTLFDVRKVIDEELMTKFLDGRPRPEPLPESMRGKPYHYIAELPEIDGIPMLELAWLQVYRAFDMGFHPDPAVCEWFGIVGRRIIAFAEGVWFKTIARDLAAKMIEQTRELVGETPVVMTYVDPQINIRTGHDTVTIMDILEMNGVPCEASINDRILYADAIHGLLGEEVEPGVPRFQVYEPGCPMLAKYLPKMRWDEKNERKMADHKFDHPVVDTAYFAISSGVLAFSSQDAEHHEPVWMQWRREESRPRRRGRV